MSCMAAKLMNKVHHGLQTYGVIGFQAATSGFEEINWNCAYGLTWIFTVNIIVAKATTFTTIISFVEIFLKVCQKNIWMFIIVDEWFNLQSLKVFWMVACFHS